MIVEIAFGINDECYKFASENKTINGTLYIRGDNVTFVNECIELDNIIYNAKSFVDIYEIFGYVNTDIKSFFLNVEQCVKFGLIEY